MFPTLSQLIGDKAFEGSRETLEKRCGSAGISCAVKYGPTPPNSSLFVRFESSERIGEICAWESGDCEVQMATFRQAEEIKGQHVRLRSSQDFHGWLAKVFRYVADREFDFER
tara:strand:- start:545 stop:883 length:339 start_codon:yes stop_codon:yes gene_type:complete